MSEPLSLKTVSEFIEKNEKMIFAIWEEKARNNLEASKEKPGPILLDHLVPFLQSIISALNLAESSGDPRGAAERNFDSEPSSTHGKLRASLSGYTLDQVIQEYTYLRQVLTDILDKEGLLDIRVLEIINFMGEKSILVAATDFSASIKKLKDTFSFNMIHDFRNPLTIISNAAEIINDTADVITSEQVKEISRTILKNSERLGAMMDSVLDYAQITAGKGIYLEFRKEDIVKVVKAIADDIAVTHPLRVKCEFPPGPVKCNFSPEGITRAMENLVTNAIKYGAPDTPIEVGLKQQDKKIELYVRNYGNPIPKEDQKWIFSPHVRTKEARKNEKQGWGLGLAYVQEIAKEHGGEAKVESSKEKGTLFSIVIASDLKRADEKVIF